MPLHYLKLLPFLKSQATAAGAKPDQWKEEVLGDIHLDRREIRVRVLPPNDVGPLIAVVGRRFCVEAGIDRDRDDAFFAKSVLPIRAQDATGGDSPLAVELDLLEQREGPWPIRDSVRRYFEAGSNHIAALADGRRPKPSARLLKALRQAPPEIRQKCRPLPVKVPADHSELLAQLRTVWLRHRLDQPGLGEADRYTSLLNGTLPPSDLHVDDVEGLRASMGVAVLNRAAAARASDPTELYAVLEDIAQLPLHVEVRAFIWIGMLRALLGDDLKRELHEVASAFREIPVSHAERVFLGDSILDSLSAAASDDAQIRELLERATTEGDPLQTVVDWAEKLEVSHAPLCPSDPEGAAAPAHPPSVAPATVPSTRAAPGIGVLEPDGVSTFDAWVLSTRGTNAGELEELRSQLTAKLRSALSTLSGPMTLAFVRNMAQCLQELAGECEAGVRALPSFTALADDERAARAAMEEAAALPARELEAMLGAHLQPDQVVELARLLRARDALAALPMWAWHDVENLPGGGRVVSDELWVRLLNPAFNRRAKLVTQLLSELGPQVDADDLASLEEPSAGTPIDTHIESALRSIAERRLLLAGFREEHRLWATAAIARGEPPDRVIRVAEALESLRVRVAPDVVQEIIQEVTRLEDSLEQMRRALAYERAVDEYERRIGRSSTTASFDALQLLVGDAGKTATATGSDLVLEHNFIDRTGEIAAVRFVAKPDALYGTVQAPLLISTRSRTDTVVRFGWECLSPSAQTWPPEWERPSPVEVVLHRQDWRPHPDGDGRFVHSLRLTVPIRHPGDGERLRVRVTSSTHPLERTLDWPRVTTEPLNIALTWVDELNPDFVRDHPIGPQKQSAQILDRIANGSSFAVIAPRRFGKSTLLVHLRSVHATNSIAVAAPVICTQFGTGTEFDAEAMWRRVSESVQEVTGASLDPTLENGLPRGSAFSAARKLAHQKGYSTIVILFDEAQAMFLRDGSGHRMGDRFKDLLEYYWSKTAQAEARVVFGLVGLPALRERAGTNLMDKLRPFDDREIAEEDLNKLILNVTDGVLQTTREARLRIAHLARNLAIAREIVERLVVQARTDGRPWVNFDDVKAVEHELTRRLRNGEPICVTSLRDVFNTAESVNAWRPSEHFPVAVALAEARTEGIRLEDELCRRVAELLGTWALETEYDFLQRLTFTPQRVLEQLNALRDTGAVRDGSFTSPLIEAWLSGQARSGAIASPAFQTAMLAAAVPRIKRPDAMEPIGDGGQATVYRFVQDEEMFAYREGLLASDDDRQRFSETMRVLAELSKRIKQREPGTEYVFDIRATGLRDDDDRYGVQVYRWIDGFDLGARLECLGPSAVAHLGYRLALALTWLHERNVLHRDIQPKNIIMHAESTRPMLIDFGLARLVGGSLKTQQASGFAAPEVRSLNPDWSRASDVWSLATTLLKLLSPSETCTEVLKPLRRATSQAAGDRGSAKDLAAGLEHALAVLRVNDACRGFFDEHVWRAAETDRATSFYLEIVRKFQCRFEAVFVGLHPTVAARAVEASDFLNQILEAWNDGRPFGLGAAKHENEVTGRKLMRKDINFLHGLRIYRSHGSTPKLQKFLQRSGSPSEQDIVRWVVDGATAIGEVVGLESLAAVTRNFFGP